MMPVLLSPPGGPAIPVIEVERVLEESIPNHQKKKYQNRLPTDETDDEVPGYKTKRSYRNQKKNGQNL
mgnify:FL=1